MTSPPLLAKLFPLWEEPCLRAPGAWHSFPCATSHRTSWAQASRAGWLGGVQVRGSASVRALRPRRTHGIPDTGGCECARAARVGLGLLSLQQAGAALRTAGRLGRGQPEWPAASSPTSVHQHIGTSVSQYALVSGSALCMHMRAPMYAYAVLRMLMCTSAWRIIKCRYTRVRVYVHRYAQTQACYTCTKALIHMYRFRLRHLRISMRMYLTIPHGCICQHVFACVCVRARVHVRVCVCVCVCVSTDAHKCACGQAACVCVCMHTFAYVHVSMCTRAGVGVSVAL